MKRLNQWYKVTFLSLCRGFSVLFFPDFSLLKAIEPALPVPLSFNREIISFFRKILSQIVILKYPNKMYDLRLCFEGAFLTEEQKNKKSFVNHSLCTFVLLSKNYAPLHCIDVTNSPPLAPSRTGIVSYTNSRLILRWLSMRRKMKSRMVNPQREEPP